MKICTRCNQRFGPELTLCPHDGEPLLDDPAALVGQVLDGIYKIEGLLGQGGMGAVYRARHVILRDTVAIKVISREVVNPAVVRRFLREGRTTRGIRHPNAVAVYDLRSTSDGLVYMVLEYIDGHTLRSEIQKRGRIPIAETLAILGPVALALDAAHAAGIVHRDVKPDNIMLAVSNGARLVKLLDLGIAKLREVTIDGGNQATTLTAPGQILGTPYYMPPEQWGLLPLDGEPEIDGRADVYSLGVVAYEMLAGVRPFLGNSLDQLKKAHLRSTPPSLDEVVPTIPRVVALTVARAIAKDRSWRQSTPAAFVAEMRAAMDQVDLPTDLDSPPRLETGSTLSLGGISHTSGETKPKASPVESIPNNLPQQITSFVGRTSDVLEVCRLVASARLVTITGPGGIGKTRLAIEVAGTLHAKFSDGIWFVELAEVRSEDFVASAVVSACGIEEGRNRNPLTTLVAWIGSRSVFLVLDNCEHLVEASAVLVNAILRACPSVRVLVTSRENLAVTGEATWQLHALSFPDPDSVHDLARITEYDAVRLFTERAALGAPAFRLSDANVQDVVRICARLEGLPLALELAAARIKAFGPAQILAKLDEGLRILSSGNRGALPRHRALEAAIGWSYDLLSEEERILFRCLSVFAGGWDLGAAEFVARDAPTSATDSDRKATTVFESAEIPDVWELLARLVDKSLVARDDAGTLERYRFAIPIRQFASERLRAVDGEGTRASRHLEWFLRVAEDAFEDFARGSHEHWHDRLRADQDNFRAALEYSACLESDATSFVRLCLALGPFWDMYGQWNEGRRWLNRALERSGVPVLLRARALFRAGSLAVRQGDLDVARNHLTASSELMRMEGAELGLANALSQLGAVEANTGHHRRAIELLREALEIYRSANHLVSTANALHLLGSIARAAGDLPSASTWLDESLDAYRAVGFEQGVGIALYELGMVAHREGDLDRAERLLTESADVLRRGDFRHQNALATYGLAQVRRERGDYEGAHALFVEAVEVEREMGALGDIPRMLEGFALTAVALGQHLRALALVGAAESLREAIGDEVPPDERENLMRGIEAAEDAVGPEAARSMRERGRAMTTDQAVSFAVNASPEPTP